MTQIFLTTTGTQTNTTINDLGTIVFTHPLVDHPLIVPQGEFEAVDIANSSDLIAAVTAGFITLEDVAGNPITNQTELEDSSTISNATETMAGIAEIATQTEVDAGLDDTKFITPLKLSTFANFPDTDLAIANITPTTLDVTSSTGNDATVPAADATDAGLLTASAQTIGGRKTFLDDRIIIDPTDTGTTTTLEIGWFNDLSPADPDSFGVRRTDGGGVFSWMNNASFPQFFMGDPNGTGESFIDATNNRPLNLNTLDTGVGSPGLVTIGTGGLLVEGLTVIGDAGFASPYLLSIQDQDNDGFAYIEILTDRTSSTFGGAGKGAFFGMEDLGGTLAQQHFALYNWQGGPITFYTDTAASSGILRLEIQNNGTLTTGATLNYEALVTADDDIPNRKYVTDLPSESLEFDGTNFTLVGDVASPGNSFYYGTNGAGTKGWYALAAAGETNTASNLGAGIGVFDSKIGVDLQFRSLVSQNGLLTIALDAVNDEVDFTVNEGSIDHDALLNFVANEHVDHTSVVLTAGTGMVGGGDISASRTLDVVGANSIVANANDIQLVGDTAAPGANQFYGTNGAGTRGWNPAVTSAAVLTDNSIVRGDGGSRGIQDSGALWTITDDGLMTATVARTGYALNIVNSLGATPGANGVLICAGEGAGDIALSIKDQDGSLTMLDLSANFEGGVLYSTIAATATANGVVYGWDNQSGAGDNADFNTENGNYRIGGEIVPIAKHIFNADNVQSPNTANWAVNGFASVGADTLNNSLRVRRFDDTAQEGIGFLLEVPINATSIVIKFRSRAQTAPGAATTVQPRLWTRNIPDNAAVPAWSAFTALTALSIPTNTNWQYDTQTLTLASLSLTAGNVYMFQITRDPADGLTGDWTLLTTIIEFI